MHSNIFKLINTIIFLMIVFGGLIYNIIKLHNIKINKKTTYRQLILNVSQRYCIKAKEECFIIKDIKNIGDKQINIVKLNWYLLISEFYLEIFKMINKIYKNKLKRGKVNES